MLRHLLENSTEKIACIVNDVASVNVDAKLVRGDRNRHHAKKEKEEREAAAAAQAGGAGADDAAGGDAAKADKSAAAPSHNNTTSDLVDTIELANGCACCSLQDELFASFEQVLALADRREGAEPYARIVLENSGVAEPAAIRDQFAEAAAAGHPLMERLQLDTLVTVVDAAAFVRDYASRAPLAARPELGDGGSMRPVVDLLVEQVEVADYVVLNKSDMLPGGADGDAMAQLRAIVSSLNPIASVESCERGRVAIERVFGLRAHGSRAAAAAAAGAAGDDGEEGGGAAGAAGAAAGGEGDGEGVGTGVLASLNVEGQHRGAVAAARAAEREEAEADAKRCKSGDCGHAEHKDEGHKHEGHKHEGHEHEHGEKCAGDDGAPPPLADHSHGKAHADGDGHEHKHEHKHHHKHDKHEKHADKTETSAARRFGIRSFVYSRRAPFHPQRLRELVLRWLPVSDNAALRPGATGGTGPEEAGDAAAAAAAKDPAAAITAATAASAAAIEKGAPSSGPGAGAHAEAALRSVLRSKGFMWLSSSHETAYYWSHAGQHFEIRDEGDWWAAVPADEWPESEAQRALVRGDFAPEADGGDKVGDRRQEIVFIGVGMDREAIERQLDGALLTEAERGKYWDRWAPA